MVYFSALLDTVGAMTSNPVDLQGLLQGQLYLYSYDYVWLYFKAVPLSEIQTRKQRKASLRKELQVYSYFQQLRPDERNKGTT
jgi:hypothetical protein